MSDFERHLQEQLKDSSFAAEYNALEIQFIFAHALIAARIEEGITQADLAKRIGTSQANISKIENGMFNPSFSMAQRIATGLGKKLNISFEEASSDAGFQIESTISCIDEKSDKVTNFSSAPNTCKQNGESPFPYIMFVHGIPKKHAPAA